VERYMEVVKPWVVFAGPLASLWVIRVRERGICNMVNVPPTDKTLRLHLKKFCVFCGIDPADISTHSWRKLFAKRIYEKLGHDLIGAQYALGHASIKSTVHYLNSCDTKVDQAIRDLWGDSDVSEPLPPRSVAHPIALSKQIPNGLPITRTLPN
jgi:site-specific recombinase XerD